MTKHRILVLGGTTEAKALAGKIAATTGTTSVTVPALPGRTCVQVQLVRANGRYSDPAKACTS